MNTEIEIIKAIAAHLGFPASELDRDALLQEELGLVPIELNDLLSDLSRKFDVSFDTEEIEGLKKVEDLIVLIEDNLIE